MSILQWVLASAAGVVALLIIGMIYLSVVLNLGDQATMGDKYYRMSPEERERFRARLKTHARLLYPMLRLLGKLPAMTMDKSGFEFRGIKGPKGTCSAESFEQAASYAPKSEDVFVVTQMKCGTTWMQHLVYQILTRGDGDIVERGSTLYAECPWIESLKSVSMEDAPLIGTERPSRVIKTHLPAGLLPYSSEARYIYVARHPVSCFASCVDFVRANVGAFCPDLDELERWFTSPDLMWWGTWSEHIKGWWDKARSSENLLFVNFEDMKSDLRAIAVRVASFLDMNPLTDDELDRVVHKCSFKYMQENSSAFEMHPPHLLAIDAELFVSGKADRHKDVPPEVRNRVQGWVEQELSGAEFPMVDDYRTDSTAA